MANTQILTKGSSFAFVEYEDRRDADDAYHDMHNKRIGRDDILKIEVRSSFPYPRKRETSLLNHATVGPYSSICIVALRSHRPRPRS